MEPYDTVVAQIGEFVSSAAERVQNEVESGPPEGRPERTLAAGVALGALGTPTDDFTMLDGLVLVSLQWDIDPAVAAQLLDRP
jgi:hypothetical protein